MGSVVWAVQVAGAPAKRVEFAVDGKLASAVTVPSNVSGVRPYLYNGVDGVLYTSKLRDGGHSLKVTTYAKDGRRVTADVRVTVANEPTVAAGAPR